LTAAVALVGHHAIPLPEGAVRQEILTPLGSFEKIGGIDAEDAAVAAHPDTPLVIREHSIDHIVVESVGRGDGVDAVRGHHIEAAAVGPDPQAMRGIQVDCPDIVVGKTLAADWT
jgi:hypothetical protein